MLDWLHLERLNTLREHWRQNPPLHRLIAGFLGYKPPPREGEDADYETIAAETADWFKDPARFFETGTTIGAEALPSP